jgi:septation ring formation regulator EzrA
VRRADLQVVERIRVPFPEIYEIIRVAPDISDAFSSNPARFKISREDERMARLEEQVAISCREVNTLRSRLEPLRSIEHWRSRWDGLRRRLGLTS